MPKFMQCMCHVLGLDIAVYNRDPKSLDYVQMQEIINDGLPILNNAVNAMNMSVNVKGPWLQDIIHSRANGHRVHKYKRLPDGLHPDQITCKLWSKKFIKAFLDNA